MSVQIGIDRQNLGVLPPDVGVVKVVEDFGGSNAQKNTCFFQTICGPRCD